MNIVKKWGSREKGGGENKIHAPCTCGKYGRFMLLIDNNLLLPGAKLHRLNNIYRK